MTIQGLYSYIRLKVRNLACRIKALEDGTVAADGNGIYSANGSVANNRTITLLGILNFLGAGVGRQFYIEIGDAVDDLTQLDMTPTEMIIGHVQTGATSTLTFNEDGITAANFVNLFDYTPSSAADTAGVNGSMCWDDDFLYVKTSVGWTKSTLVAV